MLWKKKGREEAKGFLWYEWLFLLLEPQEIEQQ